MGSLAGKIALVTGASKGIGAAIARHLGGAKATVAVNYATSKGGADRVVEEIGTTGSKAVAIQGDFSKPDEIAATFAVVKERFGRLDILVNNAGVYSFGGVDQVTPEEFHRLFDLNVLGLLLATREALELFGPKGGSVINIGSIVGATPPANNAVYAGTKGAVDAITVSLSKELGPRKIRVNSLNPGMIETEGTHAAGVLEGELHDAVLGSTPTGTDRAAGRHRAHRRLPRLRRFVLAHRSAHHRRRRSDHVAALIGHWLLGLA